VVFAKLCEVLIASLTHGKGLWCNVDTMGRPYEVAKLIKEGKSPSQTATCLGISTSSVSDYLRKAVGLGLIRASEIVFSVPTNIRGAVSEFTLANPGKHQSSLDLRRALYKRGLTEDEIQEALLYSTFWEPFVFMSDMYELIYRFETKLHSFVEGILKQEFGPDAETGWWRKGIDLEIRKKCSARKEEDPYPASHPFQYADLMDLWRTLKRNWNLCESVFHAEVLQGKTRTVESGFEMVNRIRNRVMHPCKASPPTEDEFLQFKGFVAFLRIDEWEVPRSRIKASQ